MIHRQRWTLVGGLVLAAVVLFGFFAGTIIDLRERGETYRRQVETNVDYSVTQAEVDLLNLVIALEDYAASGSAQDRERMQTRFDVLWSRLDVLASGDAGEWVRRVPGGLETIELARQQLARNDGILVGAHGPTAAESLSRELMVLRARLHDTVIDFAQLRSVGVAERREEITDLLQQAAAYFIALIVISLMILTLLGLALASQWRAAEARDLALRKSEDANEALKESEARFRDFAESSSDWFWETDQSHRIKFVTGKRERFVGGSFDDVTGKPRWEIYGADVENDDLWRAHRQDLEAHRPFRGFEFHYDHEDGTRSYRSVSGVPVLDASGDFQGYRGTSTDITEQREAERALRESEARFKSFAESASDWFWEMDRNLRFTFASERYFEITGFRREDRIGKTRAPDLDTDYPDVDAVKWAAHQADLEARRPFRNFEYASKSPSGEVRHFQISGSPVFDDEGNFLGYRGTGTDISALKEREHALRQSEQRFRDLAEGSIQGIVVHRNFKPLFVNRAFARLFGYSAEEILEMETTLGLFTPSQRSRLERYDEARSKGEPAPTRFEMEGLRKDGSTIWLDSLVGAVEWGGVPATQGTVIEITDRKRNQEALELRDRQLREAQRIGHIGHWTWHVASNRFDVSDEYRRIFGFEPDTELTIEAVTETFHEDDREKMLRDRDGAVKDGKGYDYALRIRWRDGTLRYVEGRAEAILDEGGRVTGFFGVTQDVTASRLAEQESERLISAIEHLSEGIALLDAKDRLVVCNEPFRELAGVGGHLLVPGMSYENFLRGSIELGAIPAAAADPEGWLAYRMGHHRGPGGSLEIVREQKHILVKEERLPNGETAIIVFDITDQKQREEQLRQAQKMEAVGQLTGGVAHDFNNLLAIIQGNISFLDRKLEDGSELKALTAPALRATRRGASLTRRLLAFSRQQTLDVEAVDLGDLLHGLEDMLARSLGEDISLEIAAEAELWPCEADAGQLEQAVINLANNARDAMPEGGTLRFEAANLALLDSGAAREVDLPPGEYVVLTATDAGSGILPTLIDKIFDPFFTTKDIGKGSGLGLSMVYGFVEQLGGRITARSKAGEGATFSLYLPRFDRGETVESTPATDPPSAATGETVLVVEDDIDLQTTTRMLLVDLGYKVIVASSGPEALLHLAAEPIDLLLTDVVLPDGMNGPEVARKAHQRLPSLKVVYMSGYTGDVLRRHDDLDDGTVLIRKPFEVEELSRLLRQVLDGHRLQRA